MPAYILEVNQQAAKIALVEASVTTIAGQSRPSQQWWSLVPITYYYKFQVVISLILEIEVKIMPMKPL